MSVNPHMKTWGDGPPLGPLVPQHCCIVSSYDSGGGMGCPYLAFCGPTGGSGNLSGGNAYEYACWGGCNLADPLACLPPRRPIIEILCPLACAICPVTYPLGLCLAHATCGTLVHAGNCCFGCPEGLAGPEYDRDDWSGEESPSTGCSCLIFSTKMPPKKPTQVAILPPGPQEMGRT